MGLYSTKIQQKPLAGKSKAKFTSFIRIIQFIYISSESWTWVMSSFPSTWDLSMAFCMLSWLQVVVPRSQCKLERTWACMCGSLLFSCKQNGRMWQPMVGWWLSIILPSTNRITLTYSSLQSELRYFLVTRGFCWPTTTWNANEQFWIRVYCGANLVHDRNIQPIVSLWLILVVTPWRNHETCQTPPLCVLNDEQCYGMLYTYIVYVCFWYNQSNQLIVMIHQVSNFPRKNLSNGNAVPNARQRFPRSVVQMPCSEMPRLGRAAQWGSCGCMDVLSWRAGVFMGKTLSPGRLTWNIVMEVSF